MQDTLAWLKRVLNCPRDKVLATLSLIGVPTVVHYVGTAETAKTVKLIDDRIKVTEEKLKVTEDSIKQSIKQSISESEGRIVTTMQNSLATAQGSWRIGAPAGVFSAVVMGFVVVVSKGNQ